MKIKHFIKCGDRSVANKTLQYYATDDEESFLLNKSKCIAKNIDIDVSYKFNSYGFRNEEFTSNPNIMFLGCSHTFGVGINQRDRFSTLISKQLNLSENNLAISGGSNDAAFRVASVWLDELKPKIVVWLVILDVRLELIYEQEIEKINILEKKYHYYDKWVVTDENRYFQKQRNLLAITQLCQSRNIKLVTLDIMDVKWYDRSRDLSHGGKITNRKLSEVFLSMI